MSAPPDPVPLSASRRRGGRPLLADADRRGHFVGYRATAAELASMSSGAEAAGLSLSAFVRACVEDHPAGGPTQPARRSRRAADTAAIVAQLARLGNNLNQLLREARFNHFPAPTAAAIEDAAKAVSAYFYRLADRNDSET